MKEIIPVPKNKNILDFIMELDSDKLSSKLYVGKRRFEELTQSCNEYHSSGNIHTLIWYADDVYCKRSITLSDVNDSDFKYITAIDNVFGVKYNPISETEYSIV